MESGKLQEEGCRPVHWKVVVVVNISHRSHLSFWQSLI